MGVAARPSGMTLAPTTWWGRLAIGFTGAFVVFTAVFFGAVISGQKGGETFTDNLWLFVPGLSGTLCAALGLVTGLVGVIARKERSLFVFLTIAITGLVALFLIGEFAIPPYD
jgi:hypothetical protein